MPPNRSRIRRGRSLDGMACENPSLDRKQPTFLIYLNKILPKQSLSVTFQEIYAACAPAIASYSFCD